MNDFYRHKKSDKIKWVFTGIAFVLVFVMLVGMCLQLFGNGKQKPSEWFKKNDTVCVHIDKNADGKCDKCKTAMSADENKPVDGELSVIPMNTKTMRLAATPVAASVNDGIAPQAENSYVLTATVEPFDASDKSVNWSVAWKNPSSSWANGKTVTDYVTVTPASDGSTTATVTCKQAFGEQVIVTVASRFSENVTASATVDYSKKIIASSATVTTDLKNTVLSFSGGVPLKLNRSTYGSTSYGEFTAFNPISSAYTVDDNFNVTYSISLTSDFAELLHNDLRSYFSTDIRTFATTKTQINKIQLYDVCFYISEIKNLWGANIVGGSNAFLYNVYVADCQTFAQRNQPVAILTVTATGEHSTYSEDLYIGYQNMGFDKVVQSVTLDASELLF